MHLMLLFNRASYLISSISFQYIPCYYSTQFSYNSIKQEPHFNTSYVVIQQVHKQAINVCLPHLFQYISYYYSTGRFLIILSRSLFQYIPCYYSTFPVENPLINLLEFQYISCCYSTEYTKMDFRNGSYFNTSYVVIQLKILQQKHSPLFNFNTSHVVIQHCLHRTFALLQCGFNTSYVIIQPARSYECYL